MRSPGEYAHAHIPGAHLIPLFSDEERKEVGTVYKQQGKERALELGLQYTGRKLDLFVKEAKQLAPPITLYCARGGMRSEATAWLFSFAGIKTERLAGGYKHFRQQVLASFDRSWRLERVAGLTGTGKTEELHRLRERGCQVVDLEALASHRGSVFGARFDAQGSQPQPSNEHFENLIAASLSRFDPEVPIYVEDESRMIGTCKIPDAFFTQMKSAPCHILDCPFQERVERLYMTYGSLPQEFLIAGVKKLSKRLGTERASYLSSLISHGEIKEAIAAILPYYDAAYLH